MATQLPNELGDGRVSGEERYINLGTMAYSGSSDYRELAHLKILNVKVNRRLTTQRVRSTVCLLTCSRRANAGAATHASSTHP